MRFIYQVGLVGIEHHSHIRHVTHLSANTATSFDEKRHEFVKWWIELAIEFKRRTMNQLKPMNQWESIMECWSPC